MDKKNTMLLTVIAIATLLVAVVGATFAYFSVTATNNATATTASGSATSSGSITLTTDTTALLINLDATHMAFAAAGTTYFAPSVAEDSTGAPILSDAATAGHGIYTLATAAVGDGDTHFDCTYGYKVTATITTPVTDGSTDDIKVKIAGTGVAGAAGEVEYTLTQLLTAGETGLTFTGTFADLTPGTPQSITIQSTVENTSDTQDDLAGNGYVITVTPNAGTTTSGFSCTAITTP